MAHKHFCMACSVLIEEGDFDCEESSDHDWQLCDQCTAGAAELEKLEVTAE